MDITENGFLAIVAIIAGMISIAFPSILNCARRQSIKNRKVLKQKWPSNDSLQYHQHFHCDETSTLFKRYKQLNSDCINSDQKKDTLKTKKMNHPRIDNSPQKIIELLPTSISYVTDITVNNDSSEEQTIMAQTGTTNTQITSTFTSMQSCGNLKQNLNLSHVMFKSNYISQMAAGDDESPDRLESNINDKLKKEENWIGGQYDPNCHNNSIQIFAKHKSCDKKMSRKDMIEEYKLLESVAVMIQKYEQQSRVESEQDVHSF